MNVMKKTHPHKFSARETAMYLLSRRDHGIHELQQKLSAKEYSSEDIEIAMKFCSEHGYLDDFRYAKSLVRQHIAKGHGKLRIVQALRYKRVSDSDIDSAFSEEEVDWYQLAKTVAVKKFNNEKAQDQKAYAKQVRFLQYRGFDFEQINYALTPQE